MIAIWNQREVFVGLSLEKFNKVLSILSANKIKYKYKIINRNSSNVFSSRRGRTGTFGENIDYSNAYYVYVHKKDYDNALSVL